MGANIAEFQSTLPVRGATPRQWKNRGQQNISIHAPREGSDAGLACNYPGWPKFQSTLPVRGATAVVRIVSALVVISIHAPREGSDGISTPVCGQCGISIHAPREGSDSRGLGSVEHIAISIHAPREGSDRGDGIPGRWGKDFNPRSP